MAGCLRAVYYPDSEVPLGSKWLHKENGNRQTVITEVASPYKCKQSRELDIFFAFTLIFPCNVTFDLLLQQQWQTSNYKENQDREHNSLHVFESESPCLRQYRLPGHTEEDQEDYDTDFVLLND